MSNQEHLRRYIPPTAVLDGRAALAYVDDVALMVANVSKWSESDVLELLETSARLGNRITSPGAITHFLGETLGAAASQRKMIVDWMDKNNIEPTPRTITLTDSTFMRAALTAYSWLTKTEAKAFKSNELDIACSWLCKGLVAEPDKVQEAMQGCYKLLKQHRMDINLGTGS
jgi:hypothetical protein